MDELSEQRHNLIERFPPSLFYLSIVILLIAWYFVQWPIQALDTDLWYHLNGGRYILTHHHIPTDSFFSFLSPARHWVDYYWLFQVMVYTLYSAAGYQALVLFRAMIYLVTALLIVWFLLFEYDRRQSRAWLVFLGSSSCLVLLPRALAVRPHLFTYLCILLTLCIFERRPHYAWCLPLLGIFWCNVHGVTYPLLVFICGVYLLEYLIEGLRRRDQRRCDRGVVVPALVTLLSPCITPHGLRLLTVPFISTENASMYIRELAKITPVEFLSFQINFMAPTHQTMFNAFLLMTCAALAVSLAHKTARISHVLLCVGGGLLLSRGHRFMNEFVLFALPLLRTTPLVPSQGMMRQVPKLVYLLAMVIATLMPLRIVMDTFSTKPAYPFSRRDLPQGVATFLRHIRTGGTVFNYPDNGGFLQWMLYPTYRIFMDMEIPFLFTDIDMQLDRDAFLNDDATRQLLARYHPTFLAVPIHFKDFPKLIKKFPAYVPVFFDDVEVLYVDQRQQPMVAQQYELKAVDPFTLVHQSPEDVFKNQPEDTQETKDRQPILKELSRILAVDPGCGIANHVVAWVYNDEGGYDRGWVSGMAIMRSFPEAPGGYRLRGDALKGLRLFNQAVAAYELAIERAEDTARPAIYRKMGQAYLAQGQYQKAYRMLEAGTNIFLPATSAEDLYNLGTTALHIGKATEAKNLLGYISTYRVGANAGSSAWVERLQKDLDALGIRRDN